MGAKEINGFLSPPRASPQTGWRPPPRSRRNRRIRPIRQLCAILAGLALALLASGDEAVISPAAARYVLGFDTPVEPALQAKLEELDGRLRAKYGMNADQTSAGLLDLTTLHLALVRPDRIDYAASVPKIGILLAWFQKHPEAATTLDPVVRHELGLMIKVSDNAIAAKYSRQLGLPAIQEILNGYGLYDATHGGGLWVGKHYGQGTERYGDPVANHSHAATVRQMLRYLLLLEQGRLVSPAASTRMREIFASPDIPHVADKFVTGLAGRDRQILRKAGWWEDWFLDTAIVTGGGRHYLIAAMTHHPRGNDYLEEFAAAVDDLLTPVRD
jgi:beta-lactamase class A